MKRLPITIVSAGLLTLLAACGTGQSGVLGPAPTGSDRPASSAAASPGGSVTRTAQPSAGGQPVTPTPSATSATPAPVVSATPAPATTTPSAGLPPITVQSPARGARVTSPVTVSGTADVFEAVVSVRILDAGGHEIARTFTTASCGTGCRGDYSVAVSYTVAAAESGTIEVFESSAKDGSPVNVQRVPVTLAP